MSKGQLFIVSGPSGSGKDTVLKKLFESHPEIKFSISSVTRPMREGETEGEKYNFITHEKFLFMLDNNMLLEHNEYCGNFYGTPKALVQECIENGTDIILEIDVNGAANVRKIMPEVISIFIMPPSFEVLNKRLSGRGTEKPEVIEKRMNSSIQEITRAKEYNYIVVNDVLEDAVRDLSNIILSQRNSIDRKKYLIEEVLKNVESCNR
ncbi:MAG: guanylate kinase [Oscillospiraceae bacterium]|nr:guanylate kinase [Oscillospiraceae bacterium]